MKTLRLCIVAFALLLVGCACAQAQSEAEMNELGSALTKVSSAVESTVHYKKLGTALKDDALLTLATRHDPALLAPFQGYMLRAEQGAGHAAVLMCTSDGRFALLEDASCTAKMEKHLWRAQPPLPCAFTLNLDEVCPKRPRP